MHTCWLADDHAPKLTLDTCMGMGIQLYGHKGINTLGSSRPYVEQGLTLDSIQSYEYLRVTLPGVLQKFTSNKIKVSPQLSISD